MKIFKIIKELFSGKNMGHCEDKYHQGCPICLELKKIEESLKDIKIACMKMTHKL